MITMVVAAITEVVADRETVIIILSIMIVPIIFSVVIVLAVLIRKRLMVCHYWCCNKQYHGCNGYGS